VINIGLAVNCREHIPTRVTVQDHFYEDFNPAVRVSLTRGQVANSDVKFIATAINKVLKEQLDPVLIARKKIKTLGSMDL